MSEDASGECEVAGSDIAAKRRIVQGCLYGTGRGYRVTAEGTQRDSALYSMHNSV